MQSRLQPSSRHEPASSSRAEPIVASALEWLTERDADQQMSVTRVPLDELDRWVTDRATGTIHHSTGRFFSVEGLDVAVDDREVHRWSQPIIRQPETGILGILATVRDGRTHLLMQAKVEPGNPAGHELSPTVQATRSNYTRVHQGRATPYLEYFLDPALGSVLADVRQSEQGAWFLGKRNRNVVVQVGDAPEAIEGFRWFTLDEIDRLLAIDHTVNMDARTVLACLPRSDDEASGRRSLLSTRDVLSAITRRRSQIEVTAVPTAVEGLPGWHRAPDAISHETGAFFQIVGVDVASEGREVANWSQPMLRACGTGLAVLFVAWIEGTLHALLQMRHEPGFIDTIELGPTVQCIPDTYRHFPVDARPALLDTALATGPAVWFDALLSEEGGRFLDTSTRYRVIELSEPIDPPGFLWLSIPQVEALVQHSHYLNVQARSLVACVRSARSPMEVPA
ncbi:NDP-hexose 2,3-dehydratase family protein [Salinifilum ghardaiensis]